ncbi:MAG TPA: hypothetical protein VN519_06715 [Bryobacteraceae bacterium]|nr:hypothetical protein [Bryobacteraceae bacterium]
MPSAIEERRIKCFYVTQGTILTALQGKAAVTVEFLPDGAEFVGMEFNFQRQAFCVTVSHSTFPLLSVYANMEELRATVREVDPAGCPVDQSPDSIYVSVLIVGPNEVGWETKPYRFMKADMEGMEWTQKNLAECIYPVIAQFSGTKTCGRGFVQVEFQSPSFCNPDGSRQVFSYRFRDQSDTGDMPVWDAAILCAERLIADFAELKRHQKSEAATCKQ